MNNKTNDDVSHHSVALSCLQTVQYNVIIITRLCFFLSCYLLMQHCRVYSHQINLFISLYLMGERFPAQCWESERKAIYEEIRNRVSHVYLVSFEQVHPRGEITIKVLFFLTLIQNIYNIYIEREYKTKKNILRETFQVTSWKKWLCTCTHIL